MTMLKPWCVRMILLLLAALCCDSCQFAPSADYAVSPPIVRKRRILHGQMLKLLPPEQRTDAQAVAEARWLADVSYKAGAAIARYNNPFFMAWMNNRMVNSWIPIRERGLCWHYQHDMYRELRRRPLKFYRIGCCVRDLGKRSEHHCIYVTARGLEWPQVIILDPWIWNGRLEVMLPGKFSTAIWEDETDTMPYLEAVYPEAHRYPFEHWARIKSGKGWRDYINSASPAGAASRQGRLMQRRIRQGMQQRRGKLYSY